MRQIVNKHMDYKELTADLARAADRPAYILCGGDISSSTDTPASLGRTYHARM